MFGVLFSQVMLFYFVPKEQCRPAMTSFSKCAFKASWT